MRHNTKQDHRKRLAHENALIAAAWKGGGGSGNWGHESITRIGKVGGSDPGGGLGTIGVGPESSVTERRTAAQAQRTEGVIIEVTDDQEQFARDLSQAFDGKPLRTAIELTLTSAGRERSGYAILPTLRGRVRISLPTRGDRESTTFYSVGTSGKQRGVLRLEETVRNKLLRMQGYNPDTGYLLHSGPHVSWTRKALENTLIWIVGPKPIEFKEDRLFERI